MGTDTERLDVTEQFAHVIDKTFDQHEETLERPSVFLWASLVATGADDKSRSQRATLDVLEDVRRALSHEQIIKLIAERGKIDPESLLKLILGQFAATPATSERGRLFSEAEQQVLDEAHVDLSGLAEQTANPEEVTASRYAAIYARALTVSEASKRLSVSPGRIRQRIAGRTLHALRVSAGGWRLPLWQFTDQGLLPGLEQVLPALPEQLHPMSVFGFMHQPVPDLDVNGTAVSPVDWLATGGDAGPVAELAASLPSAA
jgi:hypothetical protein